jgi:hypothetical protein
MHERSPSHPRATNGAACEESAIAALHIDEGLA